MLCVPLYCGYHVSREVVGFCHPIAPLNKTFVSLVVLLHLEIAFPGSTIGCYLLHLTG